MRIGWDGVAPRAIGIFVAVCGLGGCTSGAGAPPASCGASDELTPNEKSRLCDEIIATGCERAIQHGTCLALVDQSLAELDGDCCADAAVALYRCGIANGFRCAEISDDVLFMPACAHAEEQFDVCTGSHDNCSERVGVGEWLVECDQYAAECTGGGAGRQCVCTFGPHTGTAFAAPNDDVVASVEASCK